MQASTAWKISIVVNLIICVPVLLGCGIARGWNTSLQTGSFEFKTIKQAKRFWPEPNEFELNADIDASIPGRDFEAASGPWYYWKLRPSGSNGDDFCEVGDVDPINHPEMLSCAVPQASAYSRALVWTCYIVHQCIIWGITYLAQVREHHKDTKYHNELKWYNTWSLIVNGIFYIIHLIQTHLTYDGLAQDVSESSSQASVIVLLVMVLLMEYKNRGVFLGWPSSQQALRTGSCSWRLPTKPIELVRKYHGYAFSWATIYTLWYHPMESTVGHVLGFLHTGFLLIQQSLMFTPIHLDKSWKLLLEAWVTIHGAVVALQVSNNGSWGMFLFGFLWMFVFTQIHGLPYYLQFAIITAKDSNNDNDDDKAISNNNHKGVPKSRLVRIVLRLLPIAVYFGIAIGCYATVLSKNGTRSIGAGLSEITRIPMVLYMMMVFTALVAMGMMSVCCCCTNDKTKNNNDDNNGANIDHDDEKKDTKNDDHDDNNNIVVDATLGSNTNGTVAHNDSSGNNMITVASVLVPLVICYTIMVAVSVYFETSHIKLDLFILMIILVTVFTILALVCMVFMENSMQRIALGPPQLPPPPQLQLLSAAAIEQQLPSQPPATKNIAAGDDYESNSNNNSTSTQEA